MRSAKVQEDAGILPSASYARESLSRSACAGCPVARARSPGRQQRRRGVRGQVFTNQPVGGREGRKEAVAVAAFMWPQPIPIKVVNNKRTTMKRFKM